MRIDSPEHKERDWLFLAAVLLCGLLLRMDVIVASQYVIDADEAIVGLMAKHILEGQQTPVFYYGQHYMGSLEAVLASLSFTIFGINNFALKLVPLFFSLIFIVQCYALTKEIWNREAARISALLAAIAPAALVVWSAKARGGFIEILVIGAFAMLLSVRWLKIKNPHSIAIVPIGLLIGTGWWVNNQIVYFIPPIAFAVISKCIYLEDGYFFDKIKKFLSIFVIGALSFIAGSVPFWVYNLGHDFASFGMFNAASLHEAFDHMKGLFSTSIPILLGAKPFWAETEYFSGATFVMYCVYGVIALFLLGCRFGPIARLFKLELDNQNPVELLILLSLSCASIFALSSFGWLVQAPRYLLPVYVAVFPLLGITLNCMQQRVQVIPTLLFVFVLAINVFSSYPGRRAIPGEPFVCKGERVSRDHQELIKWLDNRGIGWVRTNYWIGYKLAFESKERIRFVVFQDPLQARIPSYEEEGMQFGLDRIPFLLTPKQAEIVKRGLERLGIAFEQVQVSGYVVLYDFKKPYNDLRQVEIGMHASSTENTERAGQAIDGDLQTRWPSAKPQSKGMSFQVLFDEPRTIRAIAYCLGEWAHDFPRGLEIYAVNPDGTEMLVLSREDYAAIGYLAYSHTACKDDSMLYLQPVLAKGFKFVETGEHPILDW